MNNSVNIKGKVIFDPDNKTRKHNRQADWKRVAMVMFEGDMAEYYAWFISKRYNITLNKPIRGAHVTFISDSVREINGGDVKWEEIRKKYDSTEIEVTLNLDARTNGEHWWLRTSSKDFDNIRAELGLGQPYFNYHMTLGFTNERNIFHSEYIHGLIVKFGKEYN